MIKYNVQYAPENQLLEKHIFFKNFSLYNLGFRYKALKTNSSLSEYF